MLSLTGTRVKTTVYDFPQAQQSFRSYTLPNTPFYFTILWESEKVKNFYGTTEIVWDFGDGTYATGASATHWYKWPGKYFVKATLTDINGQPITLGSESILTVENVMPDTVAFANLLNSPNIIYSLPAGKRSEPLRIYRFNSWQNDETLRGKNYTVNFFISGGKSNFMSVSSYYSSKWSHLKPFFGFVELTINQNNIITQKIVSSTITTSVSVYVEKIFEGKPGQWDLKIRYYPYHKENTYFCGTSGEIPSDRTIHFLDQKHCSTDPRDVLFIYAYPDTSDLVAEDTFFYNTAQKDYPAGFINTPWNTQVVKTSFNPASALRITSTGITPEGPDIVIGPLTGQNLYSFDMYPIKWANTKIPFVVTFKDDQNYTTKTHGQVKEIRGVSEFPPLSLSSVDTMNVFLMEYVNVNPFTLTVVPSAIPVPASDYKIFYSSEVPFFETGCYAPCVLSANREIKVAAISAIAVVLDEPKPIQSTGYVFAFQPGLNILRRFEKRKVFDSSDDEKLQIKYSDIVSSFNIAHSGSVGVTYVPYRLYNPAAPYDYVWLADGDNDRIYAYTHEGSLVASPNNPINTLTIKVQKPEQRGTYTVNARGSITKRSSSPAQVAVDSEGNAWVTLFNNITAFKFRKDNFVATASAVPDVRSQSTPKIRLYSDPIFNAAYNESVNTNTLPYIRALNYAQSGANNFINIIVNGPNATPFTSPPGITTLQTQQIRSIIKSNRGYIQQKVINYANGNFFGVISAAELKAKCFRDSGYITDAIADDIANGANHRSIDVGLVYFSGPVLSNSNKTGSTVPTLPVDQITATVASITSIAPTILSLLPEDTWESETRMMLSGFNNFISIIGDKSNTPTTTPSGVSSPELIAAADNILNYKSHLQQKVVEFVVENYPYALSGVTAGSSEALSAKCFRDTGFIIESMVADLKSGANHRSIETGVFYFSGAVLNRMSNTGSYVPNLPLNQIDGTIAAISAIGSFITGLTIPATFGYIQPGVLSAENYFTNSQTKLISSFNNFITVINDINNTPSTTPRGNNTALFAPVAAQLLTSRADLQLSAVKFVKANFPSALSGSAPGSSEALSAKCFRDSGYIVDSLAADLASNTNHRSIETGVFYFSGAILNRQSNPGSPVPTLPTDQVEATTAAISAIGQFALAITYNIIPDPLLIEKYNELVSAMTYPFYNNGRVLEYNPPGNPTQKDQELSSLLLTNKTSIQRAVSSYVLEKGFLIDLDEANALNSSQQRLLSAFNIFTRVISNSADVPYTTPRGFINDVTYSVAANLIKNNKSNIQWNTVFFVKTNYPFALSGNTAGSSEALSAKCFRDTGFIVDALAADILNNANHRSIETGAFYFSGAVLNRDYNNDTQVPTLPSNQVLATIAAISAVGSYVTATTGILGNGSGGESRRSTVWNLVNTMIYPLRTSGSNLPYNPVGTPTSDEIAISNVLQSNKTSIQKQVSAFVFQQNFLTNTLDVSTFTAKCNRDVGYMLDAVISDLKNGVTSKTVQYAVAYWDGSTSRIPDTNIPNQKINTLATINYLALHSLNILNQDFAIKCNRDVGYMVDAVAHDLRTGVNAKSIQYALAYWDGSTSRIPDTNIENQKANTLDTVNSVKSVALDVAVTNSSNNENTVLKKVKELTRTVIYPLQTSGAHVPYNPPGVPLTQRRAQIADVLISNKTTLQNRVSAYVTGNTYLTAGTLLAQKCTRDAGFMIDAVASDLYNGVNSKTIEYGLAYWDGSTSRLTDSVVEQIPKTIDTVQYLRDISLDLVMTQLGSGIGVANKVYDLVKAVVYPLQNNGRNIAYNPSGQQITSARQDAYNILKENRTNIQLKVRNFVNTQFPGFLDTAKLDKCTRDVGLMVDAIANDIATGVNSRTIQYALAYYDGSVSRIPGQISQTAQTVEYLYSVIRDLLTAENFFPSPNQELFSPSSDYLDNEGFAGEDTILPAAVDVDSEDNVYIAYTHPLNSFIVKYNSRGVQQKIIVLPPKVTPQSLIVDLNNSLWVAGINVNSILDKENPQSQLIGDRKDFLYYFGGTRDPNVSWRLDSFPLIADFTLDSNGNVWFSFGTNQICKINRDKTYQTFTIGNPASNASYIQEFGAIAGDVDGFIWIFSNIESKGIFFDTINPQQKKLSEYNTFKLPGVSVRQRGSQMFSYYNMVGDITGIRWALRNRTETVGTPRYISGTSTLFQIREPKAFLVKKNENFDLSEKMYSFVLQESLFNSNALFNEFMFTVLNGSDKTTTELGKVIYEKITNFVNNQSHVDTCNVKSLESLYDQYGFNFKKYFSSIPVDVRRVFDLLTINQKILLGDQSSFSRNFLLSSFYCDPTSNLGPEIDIETGRFIPGLPIVSYELFSKKYNLITNTIVPGSENSILSSFPLSGVNYSWGWGLVLPTRETLVGKVNNYYKFYQYIPKIVENNVDSVIDFNDPLTTLTPYQSSYQDWTRFGGYMEAAIGTGLYQGLKLIKSDKGAPLPTLPPQPLPTPTPTPTVTPTPTPTPTVTPTPTPTPTFTGVMPNIMVDDVQQNFKTNFGFKLRANDTDPSYIYVENNTALELFQPFTYFIINSAVNNITLLIDSVSAVNITNVFTPNNINTCRLVINTTQNITSNRQSIAISESALLSANNGFTYTFTYFNTGSIIAGLTYSDSTLSSISTYPKPTPTPTPSPTPTPTPSPTPTVTYIINDEQSIIGDDEGNQLWASPE